MAEKSMVENSPNPFFDLQFLQHFTSTTHYQTNAEGILDLESHEFNGNDGPCKSNFVELYSPSVKFLLHYFSFLFVAD